MIINELGKKIKALKGYPLRTDVAVIVVDKTDNDIDETTITFELYGENRKISVYLNEDGTWSC
jgi:hypothetical protein